MSFFIDRWRRIGTRLYIALGFAVLLTLVSSAVGIYYFEQSGDLSFRISSESVPALDAAWSADREASRLRSLGLRFLSDPETDINGQQSDSVADTLNRLENELTIVGGVPTLVTDAEEVHDAAFDLAGVIDELEINRDALLEANSAAAEIQSRLINVQLESGADARAYGLLGRALSAADQERLDGIWDEFVGASTAGVAQELADLAGGDSGAFAVRGRQLLIETRIQELASSFDATSELLDDAVSDLVSNASAESSANLDSAGQSFDQGRLLLAVISVASVVAATIAAWIWVGNGILRRLSNLSERMQLMARGDLETPMPEVGADEIGELAGALEVFRRQALEVQRLNLVEQLYEELRLANEELTRMQARLVANEKLAALGDIVSGVAHEISNPLNFVKNFSEGSLELFEELSEIIHEHRDKLSEQDFTNIEEVKDELADSLNRVRENGSRVLTIVDRMRGLGVVGGVPEPTELNTVLRMAVQSSCISFHMEHAEAGEVHPKFNLDPNVGIIMLSANDFGEAIKNLVSNACFAMLSKQATAGDSYEPSLVVNTRRIGEEVEIRFRDNGTGIADDALPRIFDPFFSTRQGALGAGLGLPVASDVTRRAGGDVTVVTEVGEYAEFIMTLPIDHFVEEED